VSWFSWALLGAVAAAATTVFAKVGVAAVPTATATAVRTVVVLALAWLLVLGTGDYRALPQITRYAWAFLILSGLATGLSWLAYFKALQLGPASLVAPIDKLSLPLTVIVAVVWLREPINWQVGVGVVLMTVGALVIWFGGRAA
jgi:transporter family protein